MDSESKSSRTVIIVGAGIIGVSVAYQLCLRGYKPTIIERCDHVASGASGKAGGFLAKTWTDRYDALLEFLFSSFNLCSSKLTPAHTRHSDFVWQVTGWSFDEEEF
jgi:glycine/D-amino acid oxidase-like deaminating enzyme